MEEEALPDELRCSSARVQGGSRCLGSINFRQGGGALGCVCSQASGDHMLLAAQLLSCSPLIREGKSCLKPQTQAQVLISI